MTVDNLQKSTGPNRDRISRPLDLHSGSHLLPDRLPTVQTVILNPTKFVGEQEHYRFLFFWILLAWAPESVHFLALLSLSELLGRTQPNLCAT